MLVTNFLEEVDLSEKDIKQLQRILQEKQQSVRHVLWLIVLVGLLQPDITLANDYNRRFESTSEQLKCEKSILIFQRGSLFFIELK
ncbi:hypothetical protein [Paenibacillus sp. FSL H7-0331]|uniref:hypothetical protein n=1 Tax=Paenibacillus sp. FSL H7-0331 TaxID=1920421 RepID=UPI00096C58FF|nr:hypothetical protein [Paenibacillus sp. FSL H7-0331]OMF06059.1 hypothetical protein BK127_31455 [Paenibacillus sp. FSL H7-0331]